MIMYYLFSIAMVYNNAIVCIDLQPTEQSGILLHVAACRQYMIIVWAKAGCVELHQCIPLCQVVSNTDMICILV